MCNKRVVQSNKVVLQPSKENANQDDMWKINWMIEYNMTRQLVETQSKTISEQLKEVELLKEKSRSRGKLVSEFAKRLQKKNTIIQQFTKYYLANQSCPTQNATEAATTTSNYNDDDAMQIDSIDSRSKEKVSIVQKCNTSIPTQKDTEAATTTSNHNDTENDDDAMQIDAIDSRSNKKVIIHKCPFCSYARSKKSAVNDHVAENCKNVPNKNVQCQICYKMFTRRGLRIHFNNFTTGKHAPRGEHGCFTAEEHEIFKVAGMYGFEYP